MKMVQAIQLHMVQRVMERIFFKTFSFFLLLGFIKFYRVLNVWMAVLPAYFLIFCNLFFLNINFWGVKKLCSHCDFRYSIVSWSLEKKNILGSYFWATYMTQFVS